MSAATWAGLLAQHHMSTYGTTKEQLGAVPVTFRKHAAANPTAVYREPLSMADYLAARTISSPLGLFDCDVPVDASTAVVVSAADTAPDLRRAPVRIQAIGSRLSDRDEWFGRRDLATMAAHDAAAMMWERTSLRPADVDVACLYDGFSILTLLWLEALGFCGPGQAGSFVQGGAAITYGGAIPLNPHGGQLSAGRTHGFGLLHEACLQIWGEAGERQVPGAEVAVAAAGGGPLGGCLLLSTN
jgi:acetyl-CoA acetyltransferase